MWVKNERESSHFPLFYYSCDALNCIPVTVVEPTLVMVNVGADSKNDEENVTTFSPLDVTVSFILSPIVTVSDPLNLISR